MFEWFSEYLNGRRYRRERLERKINIENMFLNIESKLKSSVLGENWRDDLLLSRVSINESECIDMLMVNTWMPIEEEKYIIQLTGYLNENTSLLIGYSDYIEEVCNIVLNQYKNEMVQLFIELREKTSGRNDFYVEKEWVEKHISSYLREVLEKLPPKVVREIKSKINRQDYVYNLEKVIVNEYLKQWREHILWKSMNCKPGSTSGHI